MNFYKKVLFKLIDPVIGFEESELRDAAKRLRQQPLDTARIDFAVALMVDKVANIKGFTEWIFSEIDLEDEDEAS